MSQRSVLGRDLSGIAALSEMELIVQSDLKVEKSTLHNLLATKQPLYYFQLF